MTKYIKTKSTNMIHYTGEDEAGLLECSRTHKDRDGTTYPEDDWEIGEGTEKEINVLLKKQDDDNEKWNFKRMRSYKSIIDQIDLMYWDQKNGTNNWEKHIDKVKSDYPKE